MGEYYLWLVISFLIGGLSGFQGVHERFSTDTGKAARTVWCWLYLVSRAAVAATAFIAGGRLPYLDRQLFLRALICGVSAEGLLRAQFFVRRIKIDDKTSQDITWSPVFSLLRWYQDLFLTTIARKFAKEIRKLVEEIAGRFLSFPEMYEFFEIRIGGWGKDLRAPSLEKAVNNLKRKFDETANVLAQPDKEFRHILGYLIGDHLGLTDLKEFFQTKRPS